MKLPPSEPAGTKGGKGGKKSRRKQEWSVSFRGEEEGRGGEGLEVGKVGKDPPAPPPLNAMPCEHWQAMHKLRPVCW